MSESMQKLREMQARLDAFKPLHDLHLSHEAKGIVVPGAALIPFNEQSRYFGVLHGAQASVRRAFEAYRARAADTEARLAAVGESIDALAALADAPPPEVGPRVFFAAMRPGSDETLTLGLSDAEVDVVAKLSAVFVEMYALRQSLQMPPPAEPAA